MDLAELRAKHEHPSFVTAVGTVVAYGIILVAMTLLLFVLPWLVFAVL